MDKGVIVEIANCRECEATNREDDRRGLDGIEGRGGHGIYTSKLALPNSGGTNLSR